jgi:hypothetical protein
MPYFLILALANLVLLAAAYGAFLRCDVRQVFEIL